MRVLCDIDGRKNGEVGREDEVAHPHTSDDGITNGFASAGVGVESAKKADPDYHQSPTDGHWDSVGVRFLDDDPRN